MRYIVLLSLMLSFNAVSSECISKNEVILSSQGLVVTDKDELFNKFNCAISIDELPIALDGKGWLIASNLMSHWLDGTGETIYFTIDTFTTLSPDLNDKLIELEKAILNNSYFTDNIKISLKNELIKQYHKGELIIGEQFNNINSELKLAGDFWISFEEQQQKLHWFDENTINGSINIDQFTAAFNNVTIRAVAKGYLFETGIIVDGIGLYIADSYDFAGEQPLGCWGLSWPYISPVSIIGWDEHCYDNKLFRVYTEYNYLNETMGQFKIFSEMKVIDAYISWEIEAFSIRPKPPTNIRIREN